MRKFEYKILTDRHIELNTNLHEILNEEGKSGWELVSIDKLIAVVDAGLANKLGTMSTEFNRFVFKKEIFEKWKDKPAPTINLEQAEVATSYNMLTGEVLHVDLGLVPVEDDTKEVAHQ